MPVKDENGWELIDYDYATGRSTWSFFDGKDHHVRVDTPVDSIIEGNRAMRNVASSGWDGDYHRVASVPVNLAFDNGLTDAVNQQDDKFISRFLNDSDNRAWRTKEGQI